MSTALRIRPAEETTFDLVSLGEVMLRLDPGDTRIRTARQFSVWEGGGEYNVARGLRRCFGLRTAVVTALVDNEVGRLVEDLILQGGVDPRLIQWRPDDGIGRSARNGLNFTERGFGVRGALGVSDRAHTAVAGLRPGQVDWPQLFGGLGVRWLHTGGIFAGLSARTAEVAEEAMVAAHRHGVVVSYDLNYRPSLWRDQGGIAAAQRINRRLARHVDVMFGNEEDFAAGLGIEVPGPGPDLDDLDPAQFAAVVAAACAAFPEWSVMASSLRTVRSASRNDWGAVVWSSTSGLVAARHRRDLEVFDRVGGGDSFASGLIYGLLAGEDLSVCVEYGAAHGALAMTTPGDTSMASAAEVRALAAGGNARVKR